MKCASSAEADVFVQAVALFIAVTSPIARRCDQPVWLLLRAATIAFVTNPIGYTSDIVPMCITKSTASNCAFSSQSQESPPLRMENRNVSSGFLQAPSQSKIATVLAGRWQTHSLHLWQQDVAVFCIATTSPSKMRLHPARQFTFLTKPTSIPIQRQSFPCAFIPKYCESLPTEKRNNHNEVCIVGWSEPSSIRRWHSSLRLFPR